MIALGLNKAYPDTMDTTITTRCQSNSGSLRLAIKSGNRVNEEGEVMVVRYSWWHHANGAPNSAHIG